MSAVDQGLDAAVQVYRVLDRSMDGDHCGYSISGTDGEQEPCGRPVTGYRWYQNVGEHEDMLDTACDRLAWMEPTSLEDFAVNVFGCCPKCGDKRCSRDCEGRQP